jgi:chromatin segregation and condensation protein Rec8/ScpA/Scc1 (kleisin family)
MKKSNNLKSTTEKDIKNLAILELSNNKGMKIYQENIYGDIIITK